jgi:flagellar L-ring protein precursor FlgH
MRKINILILVIIINTASSCMQVKELPPVIPSLQYTKNIKEQLQEEKLGHTANQRYLNPQGVIMEDKDNTRAQLHYVADTKGADEVVTNERPSFETYESTLQDKRDYNGPLSLGDPGVTASLWRESRGTNDIFRDQRAWQPLDLITIVVSEKSEGSKEADTEIKSKSTVAAAIEEFFSFDDDLTNNNPNKDGTGSTIDPSNLINASVQNDFKGEGETTRKGSLKAKISAMVAEVLPSGILRVEGQKIISVNSEEQVMVLSGLVRPRDINFANEIDSSKIANMRIDYYGKGIVGEAQLGGWFGRLMRIIWPF